MNRSSWGYISKEELQKIQSSKSEKRTQAKCRWCNKPLKRYRYTKEFPGVIQYRDVYVCVNEMIFTSIHRYVRMSSEDKVLE